MKRNDIDLAIELGQEADDIERELKMLESWQTLPVESCPLLVRSAVTDGVLCGDVWVFNAESRDILNGMIDRRKTRFAELVAKIEEL